MASNDDPSKRLDFPPDISSDGAGADAAYRSHLPDASKEESLFGRHGRKVAYVIAFVALGIAAAVGYELKKSQARETDLQAQVAKAQADADAAKKAAEQAQETLAEFRGKDYREMVAKVATCESRKMDLERNLGAVRPDILTAVKFNWSDTAESK